VLTRSPFRLLHFAPFGNTHMIRYFLHETPANANPASVWSSLAVKRQGMSLDLTAQGGRDS